MLLLLFVAMAVVTYKEYIIRVIPISEKLFKKLKPIKPIDVEIKSAEFEIKTSVRSPTRMTVFFRLKLVNTSRMSHHVKAMRFSFFDKDYYFINDISIPLDKEIGPLDAIIIENSLENLPKTVNHIAVEIGDGALVRDNQNVLMFIKSIRKNITSKDDEKV